MSPASGDGLFEACVNLTSITLPSGITSIGSYTFYACFSLTNVTIPAGVTNIGDVAFWRCTSMAGLYFTGSAPVVSANAFLEDTNATVYYLPSTTGWGPELADRPTALWQPQIQTGDASFGVQTNQFGFNIAWASGQVVVVDAATNLANPIWSPLQTNTLTADTLYFSDPQWTNYPGRFYRIRSP